MAKTTEERKSVQVLPDATTGATVVGAPTWLLRLMAEEDGVPPYWSRYREAWLREFVKRPGNDLLAGTIATVTAKVATTGWYLEGPERTANMYRRILLQRSDFGAGWSTMVQPAVWDYLTQDTGGWLERIRQGNADRQGAAIGFAHLDNAKMHLTGDPEWPARYKPAKGKEVTLHRSQFIRIVDSPAPDEELYGIGYCAVSRALTTARILMDIARYERERLSDLPPAGLLLLNNLSRVQWEDLEKQYDVRQRQQGNQVWRDILVAFGLDPALPLSAELFSFSQLPENFDKRTMHEISLDSLALAFRIDPRDLRPISGSALGTATEAEIVHTKAAAKGHGLILTDLERGFNDGLSVPPSITFHFDFQDTDEDKRAAEIALLKADFIRRLTEPPLGGEALLEREEGRAWLVRQGLFDEEELLSFAPEERAEDVGQAKALARVDMGPRVRAFNDGRVIRLEHRPQVWTGVTLKADIVADDGKLHPRGKPLAEWPEGKVVPITAADVARAMRKWDRDMPVEVRGLLNAEPDRQDEIARLRSLLRELDDNPFEPPATEVPELETVEVAPEEPVEIIPEREVRLFGGLTKAVDALQEFAKKFRPPEPKTPDEIHVHMPEQKQAPALAPSITVNVPEREVRIDAPVSVQVPERSVMVNVPDVSVDIQPVLQATIEATLQPADKVVETETIVTRDPTTRRITRTHKTSKKTEQ